MAMSAVNRGVLYDGMADVGFLPPLLPAVRGSRAG